MKTEVFFSPSFKRAFKKRLEGNPDLERKFWKRVELFIANAHDPKLRTHKLSGALEGQWSFSVEYDVRVIFTFLPHNRALFEDIGTHDEVY